MAVLTLNAEKSLNALTLSMVEQMLDRLIAWENDARIACVVIRGAGERAFCAGADIQALRLSALESGDGTAPLAERFFETEYRLNYLLANYSKPVLTWGHGVVMGGGVGLFAPSSHRVTTPQTKLAMPEVTIALFPDVGGSYYLNRLPGQIGMFLGLTGALINSADASFIDMSHHQLEHADLTNVVCQLCKQKWSDVDELNHGIVSDVLLSYESDDLESGQGNLQRLQPLIDGLDFDQNAALASQQIVDAAGGDPWLEKAAKTLVAGSPLAISIIYRQLRESKGLTLAEVFQSEIQLATHMVRHSEFSEGVRALLVEKDRKPNWMFKQIEDVPDELVSSFFQQPGTGSTWPTNPLHDLPVD